MIEDDIELADILTQYLLKFDIKVTNFEDPFIALSSIGLDKDKYNLIILDLTLPGLDGLEVCKELVKKYNIPIIISSARSDIADKVTALEIGADDYLPKPYDPRELEVRIKAILRRYNKDNLNLNIQQKEVFHFDTEKQVISKNQKDIHFTTAEFQIMSLMCERKNFVVSRYDILENCNFLNSEEDNGSIAVIINRIRAKIEENPKKPQYFITIRGMGYKLID
jgi:two-component system OmpR family response regulator